MDTTLDETLLVTMNISFPHVQCSQLHLDIQVPAPPVFGEIDLSRCSQESSGQTRLDFHNTMVYRGAEVQHVPALTAR